MMKHLFRASEEDFCLIHGRGHMRTEAGNPIAFCVACNPVLAQSKSGECAVHAGPATADLPTPNSGFNSRDGGQQ